MEFIRTNLQDAKLIKPFIYEDARGFFLEAWRQSLCDEHLNQGRPLHFVQDNQSSSVQGVLRGLHYQSQHPQGKLVRVTHGEVYDVIVDLRLNSSTFGRWQGFHLSMSNQLMLWVPPGFAHGFYVLSERADFLYKCTEYYYSSDEYSILWNDAELNIQWPLIDQKTPLLSVKDANAATFSQYCND